MFHLRIDLRYIFSVDLIFNFSWIAAQDIPIFKFESTLISRWFVRYAQRLESGSLLFIFNFSCYLPALEWRSMQNALEILIYFQCLSKYFPCWQASSQQLGEKKSPQKSQNTMGYALRQMRTERGIWMVPCPQMLISQVYFGCSERGNKQSQWRESLKP